MTLVIENVPKNFLSLFKEVAKAAGSSIKIQKNELSQLEKDLLSDEEEIETNRKNGILKSYNSMEEYRKAMNV